jgi:predicted enzyme related to lactoylglutathione lyase
MAPRRERGRIVWHELMTSDTAAAERFYSKVIGWSTAPFGNGYTTWQAGEVGAGGLMETTPEAKAMNVPPNWLTYVEVPDTDATIAQAQKLGGKLLVPAQTVPTVGRFAVLMDPQGAAFGVLTTEPEGQPEGDPQLLGWSWHELMTTDWKAGWSFYEALFGWVKKDEMDMGEMGTYFMFGRDRFTYGGMMNKPPHVQAPPFWLPYVMVDSADDTAAATTAAGGKVMNGPMEVPGGDRIAVLVDPQGAHFGVHSKKK